MLSPYGLESPTFSNYLDIYTDSPMDILVIEGDEKPVNVATEYASEIHTYLRAMEVSKLACVHYSIVTQITEP